MRCRIGGAHPVDLATGRMAAPGEIVDVDAGHPHHLALLGSGGLRPIPAPAEPTRDRRRRTTTTDPKEAN